jgi:hypothetical protein
VAHIRFRALIILDPARAHPGTPLHPATDVYANHTHTLMVRARCMRPPGEVRVFPAELHWDDDKPLHPGERAMVTITVEAENADGFFNAGHRFTLWSGDDVGRGVVSRRVIFEYAPS